MADFEAPAPLYLVRHGLSMNGLDLTDLGVEQAERARDILIAEELGSNALLLTSPTLRAYYTAEIIGEGLGIPANPVEEFDNNSSEWIEHITTLDRFVASVLTRERTAHETPDDSPVIIVGHAPFIESFAKPKNMVSNGEVIRHELVLPSYESAMKTRLLRVLGEAARKRFRRS